MAIDTPARHIYSGDGSTRVFPIPTYIQGDDYIRIEIDGVHQVDRSKWDIVNNSIIFITAPESLATVDVQVATSVEALSELGNVTNVDIVAANINDINIIANNIDDVLLSVESANIAIAKASEASASASSASTSASTATTKASEASVSASNASTSASNASTSASIATTKASEAGTSASIATTKASEATSSASSASTSASSASASASTATTKAGEANTSAINALASENKAKKWADENEDVEVEPGKYSAKHWANKASDIVGAGLINDASPSTSTVYSSSKTNATYEPKNSNIQAHIGSTSNPHSVTKSQVGLSNVDNTSDVNKPISNATQTALSAKQDTLVSGTNIKTINGTSVLGSGDMSVGAITLSGVTAYNLLQGTLSVSNEVITNGFTTKLYIGNGSTQTIVTDVDMDTQWGNDASEKFGGLVWAKSRSLAQSNILTDTVRGVNRQIQTNSTTAEQTATTIVTSFSSIGFSVSTDGSVNNSAATYASWNFQTTHRRTGTTNHGKAYTEHYNPFTGFTMIKYEGSGLAGHEIPHALGRKLGFVTVKNLSVVENWIAQYDASTVALFNLTNAFSANTVGITAFNDNNIVSGTSTGSNTATQQYILYGWANSYFDESGKLIGNYEMDVYQGTGAAGNKVTTKGKPAWVMIKRVDSTGGWNIVDGLRGSFDYPLQPNLSNAEVTGTDFVDVVSDGFILKGAVADWNALGGQYFYMVVYDNDSGSGKSKYPRATDSSQLNINNAIIPFAQGIDSNGTKISTLSKNETITGLTYNTGKNYVYSKLDGTYGVTKYRPRYLESDLKAEIAGDNPDYFDVLKNKWFSTVAATNIGDTLVIGSEITSRTYPQYETYTDASGQLAYVRELPKIEYKDIVKANEFKGKNACTAWANIDMTTTPPTIRDGYNVGSVIRTSAGNGDIYFKELMDNTNYTIFSSNGQNIASNIASNTGHSKTLNMFKITHWENGTTYNLPDLYIFIKGGKN